MTACALCGAENPPGTGFCAVRTCGAVLPDPRRRVPGRAAADGPTGRDTPDGPADGVQAALLGPELVVITPGDAVRVEARIRNTGRRDAWLNTRVEGLPPGWAVVEHGTHALAAGAERALGISIGVPEDVGAAAVHEVFVVFSDPRRPDVGARARLLVEVPARPRLVVRPAAPGLRVRGRRFIPVVVDNDGNAPAAVTVDACPTGPGAAGAGPALLAVACVPGRLAVPAGGSASVSVRLAPWRQRVVGRVYDDVLTVTARAGTAEASAPVHVEVIPRLAVRLRPRPPAIRAAYREGGRRRVRRVVRERRTSWRALAVSVVASVAISLTATLVVAAIVGPRGHSGPAPSATRTAPPGGVMDR